MSLVGFVAAAQVGAHLVGLLHLFIFVDRFVGPGAPISIISSAARFFVVRVSASGSLT